MILYLPLADNVGNEDAGAFPSPTPQATRVIRLSPPAVRDEVALKTVINDVTWPFTVRSWPGSDNWG